jgi:hypothetical protein
MGRTKQKNKILLPFNRKSEVKIECNGKTLSRIYKKQIGKKSMIFEYYKCWNAKGSHKNKCKFAGKLYYKLGTEPKTIEILSDHSINCPSFKKTTKNDKSIDSDDGSYEIIECNNPMIQSNKLYEKLDFIIQLHSPNNSIDNEDDVKNDVMEFKKNKKSLEKK